MDRRYPDTSVGVRPDLGAGARPPASWRVPPFDAGAHARLSIVCRRPLDHVLEFSQLYRLVECLRRRAPSLEIHLLLRSALRDWSPIRRIAVQRVGALPADRDRSAWISLLERLRGGGGASLLLDSSDMLGWLSRLAPDVTWLDGGSFSFESSGEESSACAAAAQGFFDTLVRESPRWLGASSAAPSRSAALSFLIHQSRFRVGNTLWLTPLLRAVRRKFPEARITVVGSQTTARVLGLVPLADELLTFDPGGGIAARERLLSQLRQRRFDAAIFALARRQKSRWLSEAVAEMAVPYRVNLEYFDGAEVPQPGPFTHEGWFFWSAIASPRFLLHGLAPFLDRTCDRRWLNDRAVALPVQEAWRREAAQLLADRGIGSKPFVLLAPGGASSQRWPEQRFAELAVRLAEDFGLHVILDGGAADRPIVQRAMGRIPELTRSAAAAARCQASQVSLGVLAALLERSSLLVSNDSAPIHLAEATRTPTLYFSHHEKLTHSHPDASAHWALYDLLENRIPNISVDDAHSTIARMVERGDLVLARQGPDRSAE